MDEAQEKQLKELLKGEFLPLFVGLRTELKRVNEQLGALQKIEVKVEHEIKPPEVQRVEVLNQKEYPAFPEPQKEIEVKKIDAVIEEAKGQNTWLASIWKQFSDFFPKAMAHVWKVRVENPTEFPKELRVANPEDFNFKQDFPTHFKIDNSEPSEAIPVVLTDRQKKTFYEAIQQVMAGNDIDLSGVKARLDEIKTVLENLDVTINAGDIEIGAVEIKDGDSDTRLDVEADSGKNAAFVRSNSLASQTTLASVLSELTAIKGFVDQLEGFTDGIEAALATLNAKDFATETTLLAAKSELTAIKGFVDGIETQLATIISNTTGLATQATLALIKAKTDNIDVLLSTRASEATLATRASEATLIQVRDFLDTVETKLQSLIDQHGKTDEQLQTDAGKAFLAATNLIAISGSAENDFYLLKNPTGSGKKMRIYKIVGNIEGGDKGQVSTIRIYKNPTITSNGTALTLVNKDFGSARASVMQAFSLPTISARGTLLEAKTVGSAESFSFDLILSEGHAVLVSVDATLANTLHSCFAEWAEE